MALTMAAVLWIAAIAVGAASSPTELRSAPALETTPLLGDSQLLGALWDQIGTDAQLDTRESVRAAADAGTTSSAEPGPPVRVVVPNIAVDASVGAMGLNDDGTLEVPDSADLSGWWSGGAVPGEPGAAVIVGHVDYDGSVGVFQRLNELQPGQIVDVSRSDGVVVRFVIYAVEHHDKDDFPTEAVYGDPGRPELRLITCGGDFDRTQRSYTDNVIVFAVLLTENVRPDGGRV